MEESKKAVAVDQSAKGKSSSTNHSSNASQTILISTDMLSFGPSQIFLSYISLQLAINANI